MEYRRFGATDLFLSGLGFGMNRFPAEMLKDENGLEQAANLVVHAVERGVNYIDAARNYSDRKAYLILRRALEKTAGAKKIHVCIKMMLNHTDKSKEGALKDIGEQLAELCLEKADLCFAQAVKSYEEYQEVVKPGGIYEGFLEAKKKGMVGHVCLSSHATVEDTLRMMEDGKFEGYTISYHPLNCIQMQPILEKAQELGVGILTMNSLAGGLIPQNPQLFQGLGKDPAGLCQLAIQYIYSHPGVTSVLSGMKSREEVDCNIQAIEGMGYFEEEHKRFFENELYQKNGLCTGCDYCKGCPRGIPIREIMYSYNALQWDNKQYAGQYRRQEKSLLDDIRLTQEMMHNGMNFPMNAENPCIDCRSCERKCTQSLPIVERIDTVYRKIAGRITDQEQWEKRMQELRDAGYRKVAFYPNCASTTKLLRAYMERYGQPEFVIYIIDRNSKLWGKKTLDTGMNVEVAGIESLSGLQPDCIYLTHYILQETLYENAKPYLDQGIEIRRLYQENDLPVVFLGG